MHPLSARSRPVLVLSWLAWSTAAWAESPDAAAPSSREPSAAVGPEAAAAPVATAPAGDTGGEAAAEDPSAAEVEAEGATEAASAAEALPAAAAAEAAAPAAVRTSARRRRSPEERWMRTHVPDDLERRGPFGLELWQWLAFPLLGLVSAGVGRVLGIVSRAALGRLARATGPHWDDELLARSGGPLHLAWTIGIAWALLGFLYLRAPAEAFVTVGLKAGLLVAFVWVALRAVDIVGAASTQGALAQGRVGAASVVPLIVRSSKIALVAIGVVAVLSSLGYPVASLLAGLGIGGLALALAAQKTAENMFGSVSLGVDQPLRVGDLVKIEDFLGVVEAIGLRSTRIRTADRTIVTLPNGRLADMRIENYTVRDRMRLSCELGLEYGTSPDQIKAVLAGLEEALRAHPKIWPDVVQVRLATLGAHSIDISVSAWFLVNDPDALGVVRQEMLLRFLDVIAATGARLAFPTQTLHVVRDPG